MVSHAINYFVFITRVNYWITTKMLYIQNVISYKSYFINKYRLYLINNNWKQSSPDVSRPTWSIWSSLIFHRIMHRTQFYDENTNTVTQNFHL